MYVELWRANEINGLTFGGVGRGTEVDHVEVAFNYDDGIEFFGGTVRQAVRMGWDRMRGRVYMSVCLSVCLHWVVWCLCTGRPQVRVPAVQWRRLTRRR